VTVPRPGVRPLGHHGRILRVGLDTGTTTVDTPDERFYRTYAGGGLMATTMLPQLAFRPSGQPLDCATAERLPCAD
jgi:aldehyde:ferredoxin oxidoreductase